MAGTKQASYQLKLKDWSTCLPDGDELWEGDTLKRQDTAEQLARMLSGQRGPLTVSLEGSWGTGKTFFLTRFQEVYRRQGGEVICFNAWRDDFLDDPLLSLLGQLTTALGKNPNDHFGESLAQAFGPALKKAGLALCKSFVKNALKIDFDDLSVEDLTTRGEKQFSAFEKATAARDELQKALTHLANKVREETGKPLLIIVDELDRCRPTFAVELLERIKHLFALENIVFLLGIDRQELEKSIAAVYGDIDAQGYLYRFFDLEFPLPVAPLKKFIWQQLSAFVHEASQQACFVQFTNVFAVLAEGARMSLRDVEHAIRKFVLEAFTKNGEMNTYEIILSAYAVALSLSRNRKLYHRFLRGECQPKEVVDSLLPFFDETDFLKMGMLNPITCLYQIYYDIADDRQFRNKFDSICEGLAFPGEDPIDISLLPAMVQSCSNKDNHRYFSWTKHQTSFGNEWKSMLAEIGQAISSVVDFQ